MKTLRKNDKNLDSSKWSEPAKGRGRAESIKNVKKLSSADSRNEHESFNDDDDEDEDKNARIAASKENKFQK